GKLFLKGQIPYVNYFDHKGPILIFVEAFHQYLSSSDWLGAFVMQIVFLTTALLLTYRSARYWLSPGNSLLVNLLVLLYFTLTIEGGRLSEEYCLPFIMIVVYFTIRFVEEGRHKIKLLHLVVIGASSAFIFWIRLNNLGCVCACLLYIFIVFVKDKNWKELKNLIVYFAIGFIIVSLPVLIYFVYVGALSEMLYASFLFNFKYAEIASVYKNIVDIESNLQESFLQKMSSLFSRIIPFAIVFFSLIAVYRRDKKNPYILLIILLLLFSLITTQIGLFSNHYMTSIIPALALSMALILCSFDIFNRKSFIYIANIIVILLLLLMQMRKVERNNDFEKDRAVDFREMKSIISHIPQEEYNQMYTYDSGATGCVFLQFTDSKSYYRYFFCQDRHGSVDNEIFSSINNMMRTHPPKWLVMNRNPSRRFNPHFFEIVDQEYMRSAETENYVLYKLKP
ncbi:MAG: hypothetical protein ACK5MK_09170, partial [Dysgonomonas sp.]